MESILTKLTGVLIFKPRRFCDARGYFVETYNVEVYRQFNVTTTFVQDNQAFSSKPGTIRGLHFQLPPSPQAKLIRVLRGSIFDVAVDLRVGSPTFGQWMSERLTAAGGEQMFLPQGFAHGFCTLEPDTEVTYKVDGYYAPQCDSGLVWNDATLNIPWPIGRDDAILSDKDKKLGSFAQFVSPFRYLAQANA